jgi:hypothetical protein
LINDSSTSLRPSARTHTRLTLRLRLFSTRILLDSTAIVYSFVPGVTGSLAAPVPPSQPTKPHNSNFSEHTITTRLADIQSGLLDYIYCVIYRFPRPFDHSNSHSSVWQDAADERQVLDIVTRALFISSQWHPTTHCGLNGRRI